MLTMLDSKLTVGQRRTGDDYADDNHAAGQPVTAMIQ